MGSQETMNVFKWIILGFQQRYRQDSQNLNIDTLCKLAVTSSQCIIGTENYPNAGILLNHDDDDYSQGYTQNKEASRASTKDDILQPYISLDILGSSNIRIDDVGFNFYVFDIKYHQTLTASQPNEVEFKSEGFVSNNINGYALVLTNKLIMLSSDGQ